MGHFSIDAGLNLARKWRSKDFMEIVGQDLSIRLLKNGLYKNQFFPVYLFSGQRGSGKTSTARVFAASLNCANLSEFQKDPQSNKLPCLTCSSCLSMKAGNHPDFIEIDAASNTGVDSVRQIIDSASFLPILGTKKIYLIDEAHMLSKAAFNALLKVLEEPPLNVTFILATTDPQKIIETVRSRCFQLFFVPIGFDIISKHLENICVSENIKYEKSGLNLIAAESEGSVRDAINLLERVRLASEIIDSKSSSEILGHLQEEKILELLDIVLNKTHIELINFVSLLDLKRYSLMPLWKKFVDFVKISIWLKNNKILDSHAHLKDRLDIILATINIFRLIYMLEVAYEYEQHFHKTALPDVMLQMMLLKMMDFKEDYNNLSLKSNNNSNISNNNRLTQEPSSSKLSKNNISASPNIEVISGDLGPWDKIIQNIDKLTDPLLASIFKQGKLLSYDQTQSKLEASFPGELTFFQEMLESNIKIWQPFLNAVFEKEITFYWHFDKSQEKKTLNNIKDSNNKLQLNSTAETKANLANKSSNRITAQTLVNVVDKEKWKKSHTLLSVFPGKITQIGQVNQN